MWYSDFQTLINFALKTRFRRMKVCCTPHAQYVKPLPQ
jgi:hypothetical protein